MGNSNNLLVFGATGGQGGGIVNAAINSDFFNEIYCVTRNPESDNAKQLEKKSNKIKIVKGDLGDVKSYEELLKKVTHVFGNSNYWGIIGEVNGDSELAKKTETEQLLNLYKACKSNNIKHLVLSTLENVNRITNGKLSECSHFDAKGIAEDYILKNDSSFVTMVRYSFYDSNFGTFFKEDEKNTITIGMKDQDLYVINLQDAGKAIMGIYKGGNAYTGLTIGLASDAKPVSEMMKDYSKVVGKEIKYNAIDGETMSKAGFPGAVDLGQMFSFYTDYPCHRDIIFTKKLAGGKLTSFSEFMESKISN